MMKKATCLVALGRLASTYTRSMPSLDDSPRVLPRAFFDQPADKKKRTDKGE
jgi:hypothetical protein